MKNSVQKITEQAKVRDTQGRFKVAYADIKSATAQELLDLLAKVQLFYSQDNKDKTTQVILNTENGTTIVLDYRLKNVRPLGTCEHWDNQILIDEKLGRINAKSKNSKSETGGKEDD